MKGKGLTSICLAMAIAFSTSSLNLAKAADSFTSITKKKAVDIATGNSSKVAKIDTAIAAIKRNIDKYDDLSDEIDDLENNIEDYRSAYKKLNDPVNQENYKKLKTLKASYVQAHGIPDEATKAATIAYLNSQNPYGTEAALDVVIKNIEDNITKLNDAGEKLKEAGYAEDDLSPKDLSVQDYYDTFQYGKIMPPIIARDMLSKANLQREVVFTAIDVKVKQGYDNLLYAEEGLALTQKLYDTQLKEYNQFLEKYKQGLSSEVEKKVADIGIQKLKLQLENLQRQVDNGKIQFNQAIGVDVSKQFNFTDEKMVYIETKSYDEYLQSALANRAEILAAKIDIDEKQKNFDIASKYFSETELTYVKASKALEQANLNYESLCKQVEMEVQDGYFAVKQKQSEKKLADRKLQQAQNQYNNAKLSYDAGVLSIATLWNAELGVNQAQMNTNKALRDYNNSLYEFEKNCEVGTEYVMEGA